MQYLQYNVGHKCEPIWMKIASVLGKNKNKNNNKNRIRFLYRLHIKQIQNKANKTF